jgi:hypothetical protein
MKRSKEFTAFREGIGKILRANPSIVKVAMEAEKQERAAEAKQTGKRGRGRPPKAASSSLASSSRDV